MNRRHFILLLLLLINMVIAKATHIIGGAWSYECLGNNRYKFTLKMYRDCGPTSTGFDDPIYAAIFNSSNVIVKELPIRLDQSAKLATTINSPCFSPSTNICVEEAIYDTIVNDLPPIPGGYYISYQRCCRNNTILNLTDPGDVGATFTAHIPGSEKTVPCNNNPVFNELPPIFLCTGMALMFDHSATDADGDSLVYELCDPYSGGTSSSPIPNPPASQPYNYVNWRPPYNGGYPMSSNPSLAIHPNTGLLTGTPDKTGQWVIGVCVKEYRNGVLLSSTKRDFQFNVINCPGLVVAAFPSQTIYCNGFEVSFQNNSFNASSYFWDFGVSGVMNDTSIQATPTFTYPQSGAYTVTLIANPGTPCADTAFSVFEIYPVLDPDFIIPDTKCLTGNSFNFSAGGTFESGADFSWTFPGGNPSGSNLQNPTGVSFIDSGYFSVTLTITVNGCTKSITKPLYVTPDVVSKIEPQQIFCGGFNYSFKNHSQYANSYYWTFGDPYNPGASSTDFEPSYTYQDSGLFTVTLIAYGQSCSDTISETFKIYPLLRADIIGDTVQCFEDHNLNFTAGGSFQEYAEFYWDFGPGANIPNSTDRNVLNILFNASGLHPITLTIQENGCISQKRANIDLQPKPIAILNLQKASGCIPLTVNFINNSTAATPLIYNWDFGDGNHANISNPVHTYIMPGTYDVSLTVSTISGCIATSSVIMPDLVAVHPFPAADFSVLPHEASIFEPHFIFNDKSFDHVSCTYFLGDGNTSEEFNIEYTYSDTGIFNITQIVLSEFGCSDTAFGFVRVFPEYRFFVPNAFTPDGDGVNDVFKPSLIGVRDYEMVIFNRWGETIFTTLNTDTGWNGRIENSKGFAKQDVYTYMIKLSNVFNRSFHFSGNVTLLR